MATDRALIDATNMLQETTGQGKHQAAQGSQLLMSPWWHAKTTQWSLHVCYSISKLSTATAALLYNARQYLQLLLWTQSIGYG